MAECSICQEPCQEDSCDCSTLPCGHVFHSKCLVPWLWDGHRSCPNCRFEADSGDDEEGEANLARLIQELRQVRAQRTQTLRQNLRRARAADPPRSLLRHARMRAKMMESMRLTRKRVRERTERVRRHERELEFECNELYRTYRLSIGMARAGFRERSQSDAAELSRVKGVLRRQMKSYYRAENALRSEVFS